MEFLLRRIGYLVRSFLQALYFGADPPSFFYILPRLHILCTLWLLKHPAILGFRLMLGAEDDGLLPPWRERTMSRVILYQRFTQ